MSKLGMLTLTLLSVSWSGICQTCFEGNCQDGFGKRDSQDNLYVGSFYNSKFDGPGLRFSKTNGATTIGYFQEGSSHFSIVEFQDGQLQFGYRKKNESTGNLVLHNGFDFRESGLSKFIDGRKYPFDFDFKSNACLLGNCENGFGSEYFVFLNEAKDTVAYLYVGNYKDGAWDGEGAYYEFESGDFFVGKFLDNAEWNGGIYNHEEGLATFLIDGKEIKTMSYSLPEFTAPATAPAQARTNAAPAVNQQQRGGFWRALGEVAGGVLVGAMSEPSKPSSASSSRSASSSSQSLVTVEMYISNKTNREIESIFVSSSNSNSWEDDILGDNVMPHGSGDMLSFNTRQTTCFYDLKVNYSSGGSTVWTGLDVCTYTTFELKPNSVVLQGKD